MMEIVRLPKKEFKKRYGRDTAGIHIGEGDEDLIVLPFGASTKVRMHEIAHAKLGHKGEPKTYEELAQREFAVDSWVYERLGRDPTFLELYSDFSEDIYDLLKEGYSVNRVFRWLKEEAENAGYILDRGDKSTLWWWIREKYNKLKGKK